MQQMSRRQQQIAMGLAIKRTIEEAEKVLFPKNRWWLVMVANAQMPADYLRWKVLSELDKLKVKRGT